MSPGQMGAHCECAARAASTESASMCVLRIMKEGVNEFMQRYIFSVPFGRVLKECQRLCLPPKSTATKRKGTVNTGRENPDRRADPLQTVVPLGLCKAGGASTAVRNHGGSRLSSPGVDMVLAPPPGPSPGWRLCCRVCLYQLRIPGPGK